MGGGDEVEVTVVNIREEKSTPAFSTHQECVVSHLSPSTLPEADREKGAVSPCLSTAAVVDSSYPLPFWKRFLLRFDPVFIIGVQWILASLMVLFCVAVVFGIFYSGLTYKKKAVQDGGMVLDGILCESPFGTILGVTHGNVFGYSNCKDTYISRDYASIPIMVRDGEIVSIAVSVVEESHPFRTRVVNVSTGLQWQCVEFARRFWALHGSNGGGVPVSVQKGRSRSSFLLRADDPGNHYPLSFYDLSSNSDSSPPALFGSVDGAADIWQLQSVTLVNDTTVTIPLKKYRNGLSVFYGGSRPREKDLLLYDRREGDFPYGHVAVIVEVELVPSFSLVAVVDTKNGDVPSSIEKKASQMLSQESESQLCGIVRVAEQNWLSMKWSAPYHNFSRELPLYFSPADSSYTLVDPDGIVMGWVRY